MKQESWEEELRLAQKVWDIDPYVITSIKTIIKDVESQTLQRCIEVIDGLRLKAYKKGQNPRDNPLYKAILDGKRDLYNLALDDAISEITKLKNHE